MINLVTVPNQFRQKVKIGAVVLAIITIIMAIFTYLIYEVGNKNLNGSTQKYTGYVTEVKVTEDQESLILDGSATFTLSIIRDYYCEEEKNPQTAFEEYFNGLINKTVTVTYPANQENETTAWALNVDDGSGELLDTQKLLAYARADKTATTIFVIITLFFATLTVGCIIWCINLAPTKDFPLADKFAEFFADRQPTLPARRRDSAITAIYFLVIVLIGFACIYLVTFGYVTVAIVLAAITSASLIAVLIIGPIKDRKLMLKEIDFYAENLPFDFTDISAQPIKKSIKEELQKQLVAEREKYPNRYADGGNGFDCEFTDHGVELYTMYDEDIPRGDETQVFDEENTTENEKKPIATLPYDALHMEALAFYNQKIRPMTIVIKSRLEPCADYPEELTCDLHFILDSNLLATLKRFDVQVENLDYILENKKQLMTENCLPKGKNH